MFSLYRSRLKETMFFEQYLKDRLFKSYHLGLIKSLPRKNEKILEVGNVLTLTDIEKLLLETSQHLDGDCEIHAVSVVTTDASGNPVKVLNPMLKGEIIEGKPGKVKKV